MKEKKRIVYRVLQIGFLIGLVICLGLMAAQAIENYRIQKMNENLQGNHGSSESSETQSGTDTEGTEPESDTEIDNLEERGIEVPEKNLDWDYLASVNPDIYAWIYVPGTEVDYAVLQHPDDMSYYLDHVTDGSKNKLGAIYTQFLNKKDFTDPNTVIYGHNWSKTTQMFTTLHRYEERSFFEENRYFYIYMPDKVLVYDIFAVYKGTNDHILFRYDFSVESSYAQYLEDIFDVRDMGAFYRDGVKPTTEDHLVTLSTCIRGAKQNRFLVQGVLVNPEALDETEE